MRERRDVLLIAHGSLPFALRRELAARGLILRESGSWDEADRSHPERILAAYTWFYEGLRHPHTVWKMRRWLRRHGVPLFVWNRDAPHYLNRASWRLDLLDAAKLYDLYATHTLVDTRRTFADALLYLPNAADTARYHLRGRTLESMRDGGTYVWDVGFLGAMDGEKYKEMRLRAEFFAALGERLRAKGIRFLFREAEGLDEKTQVELIQKTRINLNYGACCEYGHAVASGLPERCYGIPACGGFLLCDRRLHAQDDFIPGENWAEYDGLDDCVMKIEFWLANFPRARELAERCHKHVLTHHTYANRAARLHEALLAWHVGKRGRLG
ncbi:MAG: glycosyltransferase [Rhodocyclaceae bacterium]|nr:glycosyltransferase [Rhodocyclaceae bacterium]